MELMEFIAERIRTLRETFNSGQGMSQAKLAELLGVATNTISRWETGNYKPSIEDVEKLSKVFTVSILSFFPSPAQEDSDAVVSFRAGDGLTREDLDELKQYAEFRRARSMYEGGKRAKPGRKKSEPDE